jgi:hypothetical protein
MLKGISIVGRYTKGHNPDTHMVDMKQILMVQGVLNPTVPVVARVTARAVV